MPGHDIIVIGASAGGVEALSRLVADLPADLPATVFVVLHFPADGRSVLDKILSRAGVLPALQATDGAPLLRGRIYVAQPDHHLMIEPGVVRSVRGPRENGHRPAVDPLFRSAARAYGARVIGVVLTGNLDDGTAGLKSIKQRGGLAVVQDPAEAFASGMPSSAIEYVAVDYTVSLREIGPLLNRLSRIEVSGVNGAPSEELAVETKIAAFDLQQIEHAEEEHPGAPSAFSCPECHGVLWEMQDGSLMRYRCRVGHAFTANTLLAEHNVALEAGLWASLRALEEKASMARRLAERASSQGHILAQNRFELRAQEAEQHAAVVRNVLLSTDSMQAQEPALFDDIALAADGSSQANT